MACWSQRACARRNLFRVFAEETRRCSNAPACFVFSLLDARPVLAGAQQTASNATLQAQRIAVHLHLADIGLAIGRAVHLPAVCAVAVRCHVDHDLAANVFRLIRCAVSLVGVGDRAADGRAAGRHRDIGECAVVNFGLPDADCGVLCGCRCGKGCGHKSCDKVFHIGSPPRLNCATLQGARDSTQD